MSRPVPALAGALLAAAAILAGCGGGSGGGNGVEPQPVLEMAAVEVGDAVPASPERFVLVADRVCREAGEVLAQTPVLGAFAPGIAAEMERNAATAAGRLELLSAIRAPRPLASDWRAFLGWSERQAEVFEDLSRVSTDSDQPRIDAGFAELGEISERLAALADRLGFEACGRPLPVEDRGTIVMGPPEGGHPEPVGTARAAAREWQRLRAAGDCAAIRERIHSQAGELPGGGCRAGVPFFRAARLVGVADYGLAALALYDAGELGAIDVQFVLDRDGRLRFVGERQLEPGGLAPPLEGYDAGEVVDRAVEAIRENDPVAFNATLTEDHPGERTGFTVDGPFDAFGGDLANGRALVAAIRADDGAEQELIGADIDSAYYLLEADGRPFLLVASHQPGTGTEYAFTGYWALGGGRG